MKKVGSLVVVLVAGVALVWQSQSVAQSGKAVSNAAPVQECPKQCCEGENTDCDKAADCPKQKGEDCPKKAECPKKDDKGCCPFRQTEERAGAMKPVDPAEVLACGCKKGGKGGCGKGGDKSELAQDATAVLADGCKKGKGGKGGCGKGGDKSELTQDAIAVLADGCKKGKGGKGGCGKGGDNALEPAELVLA